MLGNLQRKIWRISKIIARLRKVKFEFVAKADVVEICRINKNNPPPVLEHRGRTQEQ